MNVKAKEPPTFQEPISHLQILGDKKVTCSKVHTEDPHLWSDCEPHSHLAISAPSVRTDKNLYVEGHAIIIVKITKDTVKIYSRPGDQAPGICAALAKTMGRYDMI